MTDPVTTYARQVVKGKYPVGALHRAACARHLRDLDERKARDLVWSPKHGAQVVTFFSHLTHFKGEWAGTPLHLAPWQAFIVGSLFGWRRRDGLRRFRTAFIELPRGNGKALDVTTLVPTLTGWTHHGDLRPGDYVFSPQGRPVKVLAVTPHYQGECYELVTADGAHVVAHAHHEWTTHRTWYTGRRKGSRQPLPRVETETIARTLRQTGRRPDLVHALAVSAPLECPERELPVPPYTFGAWLGDGHSASGRLTTADAEILDGIRAEGVPVRLRTSSGCGKARTYALSTGNRQQAVRNQSIAARLRTLGVLNNKHIPVCYLRASRAQRAALLRGLMDTDGHVTTASQCEIVTIHQRLADDICELVRSLGHKPSLSIDKAQLHGRIIGTRYRIQFFPLTEDALATLPRKLARLRPSRIRARRRQITAAIPCDATVNCIEVEGGEYLVTRHFLPTHNSTLAGGLGLWMAFFDGEPGAEAYTVATKRDQAKIAWDCARHIVLRVPALHSRIAVQQYNLHQLSSASKFEPLGSDSNALDGLRPHYCCADEVHAHKDSSVIDVMLTGMGTRRQPLLFEITTAGVQRQGPWWAHREYTRLLLESRAEDDAWFGLIAGADPEDDWTAEASWRKANPNYGLSVKADFLETECRKAVGMPIFQSAFRRLHVGQLVEQEEKVIDRAAWDACAQPGLTLDAYRGRVAYGGLDLSSTTDLTAFVLLFPEADGTVSVLPWFWIPGDNIAARVQRDRVPYDVWARQGLVTVTSGNVTDYDVVRRDIVQACKGLDLRTLAYDPSNATQISTQLSGELGAEKLVPTPQGFKHYNEPTSRLIAAVAGKRLRHPAHAVLTWNADNLTVTGNSYGEIRPDKTRAVERIDGMVALLMAFGQWLRASAEPVPSYQMLVLAAPAGTPRQATKAPRL